MFDLLRANPSILMQNSDRGRKNAISQYDAHAASERRIILTVQHKSRVFRWNFHRLSLKACNYCTQRHTITGSRSLQSQQRPCSEWKLERAISNFCRDECAFPSETAPSAPSRIELFNILYYYLCIPLLFYGIKVCFSNCASADRRVPIDRVA